MLFPLLQKIKTNEEEAKTKHGFNFATFWENFNQYSFLYLDRIEKKQLMKHD